MPGEENFQRVSGANGIFHVQDTAYLTTHLLTVINGDAVGMLDIDTNHGVIALGAILNPQQTKPSPSMTGASSVSSFLTFADNSPLPASRFFSELRFCRGSETKKGPSSPFSRRGFSLGMPQNEKLVVPEAHNQDPVKQDPRAGEFTPPGPLRQCVRSRSLLAIIPCQQGENYKSRPKLVKE